VRLHAILACAVALLSAASPALAGPVRAAAPRAAPEGGKANPPFPLPLQAFLLTGSPDSFADLQAHPGAIGVVYPTYFECALPGGSVVGTEDPEVDAYAQTHGIALMPRFSCQTGAVVHRMLSMPSLRASVLSRLVALAAGASYAGIDLDLENDGARDRRALSSFVAALASRLHAEHRRLAVDVLGVTHEPLPRPAAGFYDDRALAATADTILVMAWGAHWEGSAPGPLAPLSVVRRVARYVASLPHARRFVLGIPMYGLDWTTPRGLPPHATALQYAPILALARAVGATPVRDHSSGEMTFSYTASGVLHRVWYLDAPAILARIRIARSYGLAAGLWRLGEEDQALWSSSPGGSPPA
jgi:spore germination protein YaaH